jgi:DNA-binding NarL/FixJ family response regulator
MQSTGSQADEPSSRALRVLLVDDHTFFRAGLRNLLADAGFDVLEARNGELALEIVRGHAIDVVLMDLHMPGMSGIEATRQINALAPDSRIVMLTVSAEQDDIVDAVLAGACGYLLKDASVDEVIGSMRSAAAGESWVSPRVAAVLLACLRDASVRAPAPMAEVELTEREREILALLAEGKENAEIGRQLYLSPKTVKNHVSRILAKLQVDNRIQAAVYAVRRGLT